MPELTRPEEVEIFIGFRIGVSFSISTNTHKYLLLEKKARVAWQSLVNLLGTRTYKLISFRTVGPIH